MADTKAKDLSLARKQRGAARTSITRLKESIDKLEVKSELTRCDRLLIPRLAKKLEDWDAKFKKQQKISSTGLALLTLYL